MTLTQDQLTLRRNHLGASEGRVILGYPMFANESPAAVYWNKVGPPVASEPNESQQEGIDLEPVIVNRCAKRLGVKVRTGETIIEPTNRILCATPDALVIDKPEGIESKFTTQPGDWGDEGTDQVPMGYLIQAHQQIHVCRLERVWLPVLMMVGFRPAWRLYCVDRNVELEQEMAERCEKWWRDHVIARVPPEGGEVAPLEVLKSLKRQPNSRVILGANGVELADTLLAKTEARKLAEKEEEAAKAAILMELGLDEPAEEALLPDGRKFTFYEQKSNPKVDMLRFEVEAPDLFKRCVSRGSHRVLRLAKGKS